MIAIYDNLNSRESEKEFIRAVLRFVGYFNNAVNFYVYMAFSSGFRIEFFNCVKSLFGCKSLESGLCTTTAGSDENLNKKVTKKPIYKQNDGGIFYEESGDRKSGAERVSEEEVLLNFNRLSENMRAKTKDDKEETQSIKTLNASYRNLHLFKSIGEDAAARVKLRDEKSENNESNQENQVFINRYSTHV
jgi:hypothetical protein